MKLRIKAPDGERTVELDPAGAPIVAGRGDQAALRLPDPTKTLSREHVSFRQVGGLVTVTVLSKVSGVTGSRGPVPPGGLAELAPGDTLGIGPYTITVEASAMPPAQPAGLDEPPSWLAPPSFAGSAPWSKPPMAGEFVVPGMTPKSVPGFSDGGIVDVANAAGDPMGVLGAKAADRDLLGARAIDDFLGGDPPPVPQAVIVPPLIVEIPREHAASVPPPWQPPADVGPSPAVPGVEADIAAFLQQIQVPVASPTTPAAVPAAPVPQFAAAPADPVAAATVPRPEAPPMATPASRPAHGADVAAFARGLGIPVPDQVSEDDWVRIGSTLRQLIDAMHELMRDRAALKGELRAMNKTQLYLSENNPYKAGLPLDDLLRQLLWGSLPTGAFMPSDLAVREAIDDLRAHNLAIIAASRASVEGTVREFSPDELRRHLSTTRAARLVAMMEHGQLWRSYVDYYALKSSQMADWLEALFDKHFVDAYSREADRLSQAHIPLP